MRSLLASTRESSLVALALRTLGSASDPDDFDTVKPYLARREPELLTTAAEALLRLDRGRAMDLVRPLLESPEPQVQVSAVRALLNVGGEESSSALARLCLSGSQRERRLGLELLSTVSADMAWPFALQMFGQETVPEILEETADLLERILPERGIERLYDLRLALDTQLQDPTRTGDSTIPEQRLDLLARVLANLFRTFHLLEAEVEALESAYLERTHQVLGTAREPLQRGDPRTFSNLKARPRPVPPEAARPQSTYQTVAIAITALLLLLGLTSLWALGTRMRASSARRARAPRIWASPGEKMTALGNVGDPVSLDAEVLLVDPQRRILVAMKDRAIGLWITARGEVDWDQIGPGALLAVSGKITGARDFRNLYLEAESVQAAPATPETPVGDGENR
ncbi:MAG: HEAT repeat domain-containing protein [Candidatus Riflebacteria bacterium]|nr:HEAT repeat domain-containing protein [Candidatus Riflebacteria bacterium]